MGSRNLARNLTGNVLLYNRLSNNVARAAARPCAVRHLSNLASSIPEAPRKKLKLTTDSYAPLPSPPPTSQRPHPLVQHDINEYLQPLYTRGWAVGNSDIIIHKHKTGLFLAKTFKFSGYAAVISFITDVSKLVEADNHHPDIAFDYNMVRIQVQTHRIADPNGPLPPSNGEASPSPHIPPGLTPNDARLAITVEELFADVYLADGRGRLHVQSRTVAPASIDDMQKLASA